MRTLPFDALLSLLGSLIGGLQLHSLRRCFLIQDGETVVLEPR